MTRLLLFPLFYILLSVISVSTYAQEEEADPYQDYSYLWEDPKAKAKEEKRRAKEEKKRQKEAQNTPTPAPASDTLVTDTTRISDEPIAVDSLDQNPYTASDTLDLPPQDTVRYPVDSVKTPIEEVKEKEEPEEEEQVEEKKKKDKSDKEPLRGERVEDFRAGMGSAPSGGSFNGGFNFTLIEDQYFVGLTLNPEFAIGKVGVGLNIPILYGLEDKKVRTEMFKDGIGAARLITYIRYGVQKRDPIYVKVGQLDNTMIGFGGLINNYTNTTSFEKRKVGLHYDLSFRGLVGIDGLYSDFDPASMNLLAIRPYIRPLSWSGIPIIKTIEFGSTIVKDKDQTPIITSDSTSTTYSFTRDGIGAVGVDMGITLLRVPFIQIDLFANYSKLDVSSPALLDSLQSQFTATSEPSAMADGFEDGTGMSAGFNFRFHFIADLLSTDVRIERLSYSEHYLPQFFDATYEINKDAKIYSLGAAQKMSGIYGSLTGHILKKVELGGSLMIPDDISEETPATVRVHADLERLGDKVSMHASYIKGNLTTLEDAFTFDERSLAKVRFIYHLNKFLAAGVDYFWGFTPTADGGYKATKYVSPYFGLSIAF
ncbi:MAG: hypothetical protein RIC35_13430 [Marinoscillum sp.]